MDEFKFKVQIQDGLETSITKDVSEVKFGDGYEQVLEKGINSETKTIQELSHDSYVSVIYCFN